jgi:hypothetical protein
MASTTPVVCLNNFSVVMEPEKQSNDVRDEGTLKCDMTSLDEANEVINGGEEKDPQSPVTETSALEIWNEPRINMYRYLATLFTFIVMGMNDAAYGVSPNFYSWADAPTHISQALIPYLEPYYNVTYTVISLVFLAPFVGYSAAALLNNKIHMRWGQLGVAVIAPSCKILAYVVTCVHPPYPVLPVIFMLAGFGNGLEDGGWNAWIGNMQNANELLGFLHGAYGLGATISPCKYIQFFAFTPPTRRSSLSPIFNSKHQRYVCS